MAARLLRLWVRIPLGTWTFVCCECCVLSGRGLCDELITRSEESYRPWRVVVCDLETSKEEAKSPLKGCEYKPTMGCDADRERKKSTFTHFGGKSSSGCVSEGNRQKCTSVVNSQSRLRSECCYKVLVMSRTKH
jgi:hypothetical protein